MTVHNTDPSGNNGPKGPAGATEVGLVSASGKDIYSAGVSDSALIRELTPGHLTPEVFEQWCRTKAATEGCDPVDVAFEYAWSVING